MKKLNIKIIAMAILVAFCSAVGLGGNVFAEGRKAFVVSPMTQRIVLTPGETYRGSLIVANPAGAAYDFDYIAEVSSYYPLKVDGDKDDYGGATYSDRTNANMIVDWVTIDNPTGTLKPNEERTVTFSIDVPRTAPAGGQYAAILVREDAKPNAPENSESITEIMQIAHVIYADVTGTTTKSGEILENNIPSFLLNNKLEATSRIRNTGNVHTDAEYVLQVWPLFSDEEICTNEENPSTSIIVPNTERYHTESCDLPMVGIFRAKQTVKIFDEISVVERTVIVCPLWLLFLILFVIMALIIWIVMRVRSHKKKAEIAE